MAALTKHVNHDIRAGDLFETVYPFRRICDDFTSWEGKAISIEKWIGGCHKNYEPADHGYGDQVFYTADAEGKRILEVLAVAEMPGNWQRRIIYACHLIEPDGKERRGKMAYTVTESRFIKMSSGYFADYVLEEA